MKRLILPFALLGLALSGCGDDETDTPPTGETDTDPSGDVGLDIPIDDDTECTPNCAGRECGDDGCEGSCGECGPNADCTAGVCVDSTPDALDCPAVIECINASGGTQEGMTDCISQGTAEAQDQINDILICIQDNCSDPDMTEEEFGACQQEFCAGEINACFGIGTGSATCPEVIECLLGCTTQECANECVGTGSAGAQAAAVDYFNCAVESCAEVTTPEEFYSCAEASCPTEAAECAGS